MSFLDRYKQWEADREAAIADKKCNCWLKTISDDDCLTHAASCPKYFPPIIDWGRVHDKIAEGRRQENERFRNE